MIILLISALLSPPRELAIHMTNSFATLTSTLIIFRIPSHDHRQLKRFSIMNDLLYDCVFAVVSILSDDLLIVDITFYCDMNLQSGEIFSGILPSLFSSLALLNDAATNSN